jgi:hypothetical protein
MLAAARLAVWTTMRHWAAGISILILLTWTQPTRPANADLRLLPLADGPAATSPDVPVAATRAAAKTDAPITAETGGFDVDEMLRAADGQRQHWARAPELVVLTSVMEYRPGPATAYVATPLALSPEEVVDLTTDLTAALAALSNDRFKAFAAIHFEAVPSGMEARITRPGQIVVARFRGLRTLLNEIGLGGRTSRTDGTITSGAIVLDSDYDAHSGLRRLLRTHELGHALGFNHVQSRASIMNPRIGSGLTESDRTIASVAFDNLPQ